VNSPHSSLFTPNSSLLTPHSSLFTPNSITRYSLYALLIFTPLARASVQPWAITIIHMVTLIALTAFLLEKTMAWDWKWIKTPLDKPFIALAAFCLLSSVFSLHRTTSFWSMILLLNYLIIFYLTIHTFRTRSQLRQFVYLIIGVAAFISIFGLFKYFGSNPFPWWEYNDVGMSSDRLTATFGNPDHLAGYMEMTLPLVLGLFLIGFERGKKFFIIYLAMLILAALIFSLSRGAWFGSITGLTLMAAYLLFDRHFKRKGLVLGIIGVTLAAAFIVLSTTPVVERILTLTERAPESNLHSRMMVWGGAVRMIENHPVLGTGPGTFAFAYTKFQPPGLSKHYTMAHNDYLHFVSEVGLPLIAIIIWMIIALYRKGFRKLKNPSRLVRGITLGAMSGITAILVHSVGDFNLHIPCNVILFVVLSAIIAAPLPKNS
jgi:O-antigen ligase